MFEIAFLTGLFGSLHCVGMCGAIALTLPARGFTENFFYNMGRVLTYAFMGLLMGFFGKGLSLMGFQQQIAIVVGVVIILFTLFPKLNRWQWFNQGFANLKALFKPFYQRKTRFALFMIGVLNGFLPCGLVYVALMGAIVTIDMWKGALYMLLFGMGTIPMMQSLTLYKTLLSQRWRVKLYRLVPFFAVFVGFLIILRGLNLGIPYLSPHFKETKTVECHSMQ